MQCPPWHTAVTTLPQAPGCWPRWFPSLAQKQEHIWEHTRGLCHTEPCQGEKKGGEGQRHEGEGGGERRGAKFPLHKPPLPSAHSPMGKRAMHGRGAFQLHPKAAGHTSTDPPALQLQPQHRGHYLAGTRPPGGHSRTVSGSGSRRSRRPAARPPPRAGGSLEPAQSTAPQPQGWGGARSIV